MPIQPGKESVSAAIPATDVTRQELPYRLRQQSLLGEFGRSALQTRDIEQILQRATELCAQGLETPFAKVLEYLPDDKRLLVRAGVGWVSGTIGHVLLGIDMESPAGYAFHTGQIVISNHLQQETRRRRCTLKGMFGRNSPRAAPRIRIGRIAKVAVIAALAERAGLQQQPHGPSSQASVWLTPFFDHHEFSRCRGDCHDTPRNRINCSV